MSNKNNQHEDLPYTAMTIAAGVIFVSTAVIGVIRDSNLWPLAAVVYSVLGAILVFLIVFIFCKIKFKM